MLAVVDYGVGNLANVERALVRAGARDVVVTSDRAALLSSSALVLPGVGHFGHCARELARRGLDVAVRDARAQGIPLLGLCVGMQLFFEGSDEDPQARGLGLVAGTVRRLTGAVRVPHTGWNEVHVRRPHPWLATMTDGAHFYFVHSYAPEADGACVVATTQHGAPFASIVGGDGFLGLQFHPEKSSLAGTRLLHSVMSALA
jgi:glutamine amidotransferase